MMARPFTFRGQMLLIVTVVGVAPLALLGLWLAGSGARSGEALLRTRLQDALDRNARAIEVGWVRYRSAILDFGDAALATPGADRQAAFDALSPTIQSIVVRNGAGAEVARFARRDPALLLLGSPLQIEQAVFDASTGEKRGVVEAALPLEALRNDAGGIAAVGGVLTAFDETTKAVLLPTAFDLSLLEQDRFHWNNDEWVTMRRTVAEPRIQLVAAAPLTPFTQPLQAAARRGAMTLATLVLLGTVLAAVLTRRLSGSLERLAGAADAVAAGDLRQSVESSGSAEVARVSRAFNTMTTSLRSTLDQLAERESLTAVNEFAAALAHEVRNPLSSIQLDLQQVEERLPPDSPLRTLQSQALHDLRRLNQTVGGALETARSGRLELRTIDLREPLQDAIRAARPRFDERQARLHAEIGGPGSALVHGDAVALHRLFLNLLLNAADALPAGGAAQVSLSEHDRSLQVSIRDNGEGMAPERLARVFDAFFTTRPGGTGIGLAVARRIVTAHRGEIDIRSEPNVGTTVEVRLPRAG